MHDQLKRKNGGLYLIFGGIAIVAIVAIVLGAFLLAVDDDNQAADTQTTTTETTTTTPAPTIADATAAFQTCMSGADKKCFPQMAKLSAIIDNINGVTDSKIRGLIYAYDISKSMFAGNSCGLPGQEVADTTCLVHSRSMIRTADQIDDALTP